MNIVVLDGYTLNPDDLSWESLESFGDCSIYDRTPAEVVVKRCREAELVLTNKTPVSRESIDQLQKLRYIGVMATGYNIVDVETAAKKGISVTNVPSYGTKSVAQMTFALILELNQHVGRHADLTRKGRWAEAKDWCFWEQPLTELADLTLGIIGFGRIGQAVGQIARAFGMKVFIYDPVIPPDKPDWAMMTDLDTIFRESDIISLHCPLTAENERFINSAKINLMKQNAILINTSRGQLINESELADALNTGRIAGAGLDVLSVEPPKSHNPLLTAKNCLVTPHYAWATRAARIRLLKVVVDNVSAFLSGNTVNLVNAIKK